MTSTTIFRWTCFAGIAAAVMAVSVNRSATGSSNLREGTKTPQVESSAIAPSAERIPAAPATLGPEAEALHASWVEQFVASEGFGLSRLVTPIPLQLLAASHSHGVRFTRLVSLLEHDEPTLYLDHDPIAMKRIPPDGRTRPLTEGELTALARLESETIVPVGDGEQAWMGALRADERCLDCHDDATKGDLLGAFLYSRGPVDVGRSLDRSLDNGV